MKLSYWSVESGMVLFDTHLQRGYLGLFVGQRLPTLRGKWGSPCHCRVKHWNLSLRVQGNNIAWAIAPNYSYSGYCSPLSRGFPAQQGQMETHQETADTNSEQASPFLLLSFAKTTISAVEIQGGNFLFAWSKQSNYSLLELYVLASHNIAFHLTAPAIHYPSKWNLAALSVFRFFWISSYICCRSRKRQLSSVLSLAQSFFF